MGMDILSDLDAWTRTQDLPVSFRSCCLSCLPAPTNSILTATYGALQILYDDDDDDDDSTRPTSLAL